MVVSDNGGKAMDAFCTLSLKHKIAKCLQGTFVPPLALLLVTGTFEH